MSYHRHPRYVAWTEADDAAVRDGFFAGIHASEIARQLGRSEQAVYTRKSRLGLSVHLSTEMERERALELAHEGATAIRISRSTGISIAVVELLLRRHGLQPKVLSSYPNAGLRYGFDLPLPAPRREGAGA